MAVTSASPSPEPAAAAGTSASADTPGAADAGLVDVGAIDPGAVLTAPVPIPATPSPVPSPTDMPGSLEGAEELREALGAKNLTIGEIVNRLDAIGFTVADTRVSLWSALLVVLVIVGIFLIARIGSRLSHSVLKRFTRLSPTQNLLAEKLLSLSVWSLAILIGIDILGIDLTALAVFSGAFGLAIGFGLQRTFGNLIAGIILLMDRSIKPGDVIAVSDMAGVQSFGQIRKIGIRAVSVTTRDEREYLIPNENLMVNQVENWSYSSRNVRMQVPVGISYDADIKQAEELMLEAAKSCKRVLELPAPSVWLNEFGESSVNFTIHCWIDRKSVV